MLYSMNFYRRNRHERRLFYAGDEAQAREMMLAFAERLCLLPGVVWLEKHSHGFILQREKLGPRYWPPEEKKPLMPFIAKVRRRET